MSCILDNTEAGLTGKTVALLDDDNTFTGALRETGIISPAQLVANTDDWAPTGYASARMIRLSTDASRNLTGITATVSGHRLALINIGAQNCVLKHDATSTAANRFYCPGSVDYTLGANEAVEIWYDTASTRWRVFGTV